MQDYLLNIETWALRELENFSFLSACFSSKARQALLPRFKNNFYRYRAYFDDWADKYVLHLVNFSMNTVLKKEFQSLPSELKEISKMMEQYSRLKWQVVHLVRYLYLQILVAAIEEQPERLQLKFQRLKALNATYPEANDLTDFYVRQTMISVTEINQRYTKLLAPN